MRLNIGLPGPFSTSHEVNGGRAGQGCLGLVILASALLFLCCCAGSIGAAVDRITGNDMSTTSTEGVAR